MEAKVILEKIKEHIEAKQYDAAEKLLVSNKSLFDKEIYDFNRGSLKSFQGDFAAARYYLERAKQEGFDSDKTNSAIAEVKQSLGLQIAEDPRTVEDHFDSLIANVGVPTVFICLSLVLFIAIILSRKVNLWKTQFFIIIIASVPLLAFYDYSSSTKTFVSLTDQDVRSGPSKIFEEEFVLPKGVKYKSRKSYEDWIYINTPAKYNGWKKMNEKEEI